METIANKFIAKDDTSYQKAMDECFIAEALVVPQSMIATIITEKHDNEGCIGSITLFKKIKDKTIENI